MFVTVVIFVTVVVGVGIMLVAAALLLMANMLLRPPRMTDGKAAYVLRRISPGDLGLRFEELRFDVLDERTGRKIGIAAWWMPHARADGKCVVLIHGYGDGKVGAIAWAPMWHALGYSILAIDLRAHGYSGGKFSTAGFFEHHDLDQVLDQILAEREGEMRQIVMFGISLGAAVALASARKRNDLAALVLECPYADYRHAIAAHARIMQTPLPALAPIAVRLAEWISSADFQAVRPVEMLQCGNVPVLVIDAADDPLVPREDAEAIAQVLRQRENRGIPSVYWPVEGAAHMMGATVDAEAYRQRISDFLSRHVKQASPAADTARCR